MGEEREGCAGVCMGRDSVCGRAGRDVAECGLLLVDGGCLVEGGSVAWL